MFHIPDIVVTVVAFMFSVGVLIVAHEWGHYIMAKRGGVPVEEFSVGFGPVIRCLGHQGETTFNLRAFPVGGFVRMTGMEPGDETANGYNTKPIWTRAKIIVAGVVINLLLGMVTFIVLGATVGLPNEKAVKVSVGDVTRGSAAERAGLIKGDRILSINGTIVNDPTTLTDNIRGSISKPVVLSIQRGTETLSITATPAPEKVGGKVIGRLGFALVPDLVWEKRTLLGSVEEGVGQTWGMAKSIVSMVFSKAMFERGRVGGPIAIAQEAGGTAQMGAKYFAWFLARLSVNLGVLNLLPIPALDGGHMLLLGVEAVRRRKLQAATAMWIQGVGFALLLLFIFYATGSDLMRIFHKG